METQHITFRYLAGRDRLLEQEWRDRERGNIVGGGVMMLVNKRKYLLTLYAFLKVKYFNVDYVCLRFRN